MDDFIEYGNLIFSQVQKYNTQASFREATGRRLNSAVWANLMLWLFDLEKPDNVSAIQYYKRIVEEADAQWELTHPQKPEKPEPEKPKNPETEKVFPVSPAETPKRGRPSKIDKELARALLEEGLTQQQVADKLGCSRKTISRLVNEGMRQNSETKMGHNETKWDKNETKIKDSDETKMGQNSETKMGQNSNYVAPILSHPPVSFDKYI